MPSIPEETVSELEPATPADERGISRRAAEYVVAAILIAIAGLVLWDSYGRGAGWDMGPENGYFPARVGWIFLASSIFILVDAFRRPPEIFVTWVQLSLVARVFLPLLVYVALIKPLGIYVSSALFIVCFMLVAGSRNVFSILATAILVPVICFWVFEIQFLVSLPKGPLEAFLGY
ncbi:tripartite tricarboxylate transporter TctB family protein [Roseixanthobacter glucoisosaccharinicivorans]|uniref:tripartite tricarboxylate transporter TctB family protein n=1 Tax=Roseixanthobacter glucoisosaccharinicivorans TaxID=3119923 RepID=UPI00372B8561